MSPKNSMVREPALCEGNSASRDSDKPTGVVESSTAGSSDSSVSSAIGRNESIEVCKQSDTQQGFPVAVQPDKNETAEIEAVAGCSCFPLRLRAQVRDPSLRHQGAKSKRLSQYSSIGDLTDTFYEEKEPGRRPYDLPSYGSGGAHRSARASQRHFREWL